MNSKAKTLIGLFLIINMLVASCKNNDDSNLALITDVTTSSGNIISLNGQWVSGCVTDMGTHLDEVFNFEDTDLVIDISIFKEENCNDLAGKEKVIIEFQVVGTIEALLNGNTVIANKITGTQTMQSSGVTKEFKQIFYVSDEGDDLFLHHARFQDDGGEQSSDGFPIELIPIEIVNQ